MQVGKDQDTVSVPYKHCIPSTNHYLTKLH